MRWPKPDLPDWLTGRRALNALAIAAVVTVLALLVSSLIFKDGKRPDVLRFPTQRVVDQTPEDEGHPTVAPGRLSVRIEGALCNISDEAVDTRVELFFERPGGPSIPTLDAPLHQRREPGCEWHLVHCPDNLADLRGPAAATSCLPPFINPVPRSIINNLTSYPWTVTGTVTAVDHDVANSTLVSEPFGVAP